MGCASALERLVLHAFSTGGHVRLDFPGWGFLLFLVATIVDHVYPDPFILLWGLLRNLDFLGENFYFRGGGGTGTDDYIR